MKNRIRFICRQILIAGICMIFFLRAYAQSENYKLPDPQIKAGIAKLYGKIIIQNTSVKSLTLSFYNPVTDEESVIERPIKNDGSFYFEVPIECSSLYGYLGTNGYRGCFIPLYADQETKLNLYIDDSNRSIYLSVPGVNFLDKVNIDKYPDILNKSLDYRCSPKPIYEMTPQEFAQYEIEIMNIRIEYALKGIELSNAGRVFITNNLKLFYLNGRLLSYKDSMELALLGVNGKEKADSFSPQEPDRTYYTFLKSFNLNDPQYIYSPFYSNALQYILNAKALNIPPIADTPVGEWLRGVKATLSDLVGFKSGQFYDMLAANAYAKQFNNKCIPLSEKQKKNIKNYYGDSEIAKILFRKNNTIVEMATDKCASIINETPDVPKEKIMDTIVSKYKGKVVVVDLWATWCGPCMEAIKRIKDLKHELKGKDVVYVYITNGSSPKKLWGEVIANINGEHYYISGEKWKYIMESFGFEYIPSYLIYDTQSRLRHKFTNYPGNNDMKKMIEELLP